MGPFFGASVIARVRKKARSNGAASTRRSCAVAKARRATSGALIPSPTTEPGPTRHEANRQHAPRP